VQDQPPPNKPPPSTEEAGAAAKPPLVHHWERWAVREALLFLLIAAAVVLVVSLITPVSVDFFWESLRVFLIAGVLFGVGLYLFFVLPRVAYHLLGRLARKFGSGLIGIGFLFGFLVSLAISAGVAACFLFGSDPASLPGNQTRAMLCLFVGVMAGLMVGALTAAVANTFLSIFRTWRDPTLPADLPPDATGARAQRLPCPAPKDAPTPPTAITPPSPDLTNEPQENNP
jgi:hypothetical protein